MGGGAPSEVVGRGHGADAVVAVVPRLRGVPHAVAAVVFPALGLMLVLAVPASSWGPVAIYTAGVTAMYATSACYHRGRWSVSPKGADAPPRPLHDPDRDRRHLHPHRRYRPRPLDGPSAAGGRVGPDRCGHRDRTADAVPEPLYHSVEAWVAGWFAPTFARRLGTTRWCAQWWLHAEAIVRLEALWRSWETLRLDPNLGMATWLRDHLDPQR